MTSEKQNKILIVDDESGIRSLIKGILEDEGYATCEAANDKQAHETFAKEAPDLVILDIWLEGSEKDGIALLKDFTEQDEHIPVLMISGHGSIETAVNAIKIGAYDFIEKPFKTDRLLLMIKRALETSALKRENAQLRSRQIDQVEMIAQSSVMNGILSTMMRIAPTNSRILLLGEAGTGKDIAARFLHAHSQRADQPFVALNCAVMRPDKLELELFGRESEEQGQEPLAGVLEQAHGGTLFLDEVADMPLETQAKILRVVQEQKFRRSGGQEQVDVDIRIISSSNRDLEKLVEDGRFRKDLFYRLNVVSLTLPPLRGRGDDISALIKHFGATISETSGVPVFKLAADAQKALNDYEWPGNVRQLRNMVEWLLIMHGGKTVSVPDLPPEISGINPAAAAKNNMAATQLEMSVMKQSLKLARKEFEKHYLALQLKRFKGNVSRTASFVGMERSALHRKLKKLGIQNGTQESANNDSFESLDKASRKAV